MGHGMVALFVYPRYQTCGFNAHRECKRLIVIGETEGRAGYENCEIMKTIITDSECLWTDKGINSRPGNDSAAVVILSNNKNVVKNNS